MSDTSIMELLPVPTLNDLPDDIRDSILAIQEKSGFIPNVFLALAARPAEFRAFFAYHDALMENPSNLTKAEKEMIVVATSSQNRCQYCVVAHGAILRIRAKSSTIADQIAINHNKAAISTKQKAMLDFALKVSKEADNITAEDKAQLYQLGFTPEDLWEITSITGFFGLSNRIVNVANIPPNPEFYNMGRQI